jgi:hypothetical protein
MGIIIITCLKQSKPAKKPRYILEVKQSRKWDWLPLNSEKYQDCIFCFSRSYWKAERWRYCPKVTQHVFERARIQRLIFCLLLHYMIFLIVSNSAFRWFIKLCSANSLQCYTMLKVKLLSCYFSTYLGYQKKIKTK